MDSKHFNLGFALFLLAAMSLTMLAVPAPTAKATPSYDCFTAPPPDLKGSGYGVTSSAHGQPVIIGASVTVYACTTDTTVKRVLFTWTEPDKVTVAYSDLVTAYTDSGGVRQFTDTHLVNALGDWGVKGAFCPASGSCLNNEGHKSATIAIRATSFLVLNELPFGSIAAVGVAFVSFFAVRRLSKPPSRTSPF